MEPRDLYTAVIDGDEDTVRQLINSDVNINTQYGSYTPLHLAVLNGYTNIVQLLLQNNCDVNKGDSDGWTPLYLAVSNNYTNIVQLLLAAGCDVNKGDSDGWTPLHLAVNNNNTNIAQLLLAAGCDVNKGEICDRTPLHLAVSNNYTKIVQLLLTAGCDVNKGDSDGWTPLHLAVSNNNINIVQLLLTAGCDVNNFTKNGDSAFIQSLHHYLDGNTTITNCLLQYNCQVILSTKPGLQILYKIAERENIELVRLLLHHGCALIQHPNNKLQLVHYLLTKNNLNFLMFYITHGLYINSLTDSGENILHLLARFYMEYLDWDFSFLFLYGLDFNLRNVNGNSCLMIASILNNKTFLEFLCQTSCNPNLQNNQGHTALHLCIIGFTVIKEKLNKRHIQSVVEDLCSFNYHPNYTQCIDILLSLHPNVNIQDNRGQTALMLAVKKNDKKLTKKLLECGADVNLVDNEGRSAVQYVDFINNGCDLNCFNLLLSYGGYKYLDLPQLNGNTIIQNMMTFPALWQVKDIVYFIKFLIYKNVSLQNLIPNNGDSDYPILTLDDFPSIDRKNLRKILYLSGAPSSDIISVLNFEREENDPQLLQRPREEFTLFCNNLNLKEHCRRIIRQNTGLEIHDRIFELDLGIPDLNNYLLFNDDVEYGLPHSLDEDHLIIYNNNNNDNDDNRYIYVNNGQDHHINNDNDDYNSYDLNLDYDNDYLIYQDVEYLNDNIFYNIPPPDDDDRFLIESPDDPLWFLME